MQDQLAAAENQQGQNAAQAQEVTRLQREVADLQAEIAKGRYRKTESAEQEGAHSAADAQSTELQAQLAQAKQGISLLKSRVLARTSTPDAPSRKFLPDKDLFLTSSPSCSVLTQHGNTAWQLFNAQDSVQVQAVSRTLCSPCWPPCALTDQRLEAEHVLQHRREQKCIC